MSIKRITEQELLDGLDAKGAHAEELAEPLPQELEPLERLRGRSHVTTGQPIPSGTSTLILTKASQTISWKIEVSHSRPGTRGRGDGDRQAVKDRTVDGI